jgi:Domain of unknown function (DUF4386)
MTEQLSVSTSRPTSDVSPPVATSGHRDHRGAAIAAGVLYITGTVAGILSKAVLSSVSGAADPVATASTHQATVVTGAMLILVMGLSLALIPVVLMPVLRPVSEFLAYGYLVIRGAVETACYVVLAAGVLSLVALGGLGGAAETWRELGRVLVDSEATASVLTVVFCLGATLFYLALLRSGIAPRWISVWGLVGIPLYVIAALLAAYGAVETNSTAQNLLFMPLALQEMVLAIWMIARGFLPAQLTST